MRKKIFVPFLILIMISMNITFIAAQTTDPFDYAKTLYEYITKNYYGDIDQDVLAQNLIKAIADTLDKYSIFLTVDEAENYFNDLSGEFEGIGISFVITDGVPQIVSIIRGGPAQKAGMLPGDKIVLIDDIATKDLSNIEIIDLIKGQIGEPVILVVEREGYQERLSFSMNREKIIVNPVSYRVVAGDVGYLKITVFSENTFVETQKAYDYFKQRGIKKLILDLRNNGGGLVSQAVMVAGLFITEGVITTLDFVNEEIPDIEYSSDLKEAYFQLSVLVNENSASAAELLASAIQERNAGVIIGWNTFGKGIFQTGQYIASYSAFQKYFANNGILAVAASQINSFGQLLLSIDHGGYFQLTSGRYLTPEGKNIHGIGVLPDIVVAGTDAQNISNIDMVSDYYNYDAGLGEMVIINAKKILYSLGMYVNEIDPFINAEFIVSLKKYQSDNGLVSNGELNYITKRMLDRSLEFLLLNMDEQLKEAVNQLD